MIERIRDFRHIFDVICRCLFHRSLLHCVHYRFYWQLNIEFCKNMRRIEIINSRTKKKKEKLSAKVMSFNSGAEFTRSESKYKLLIY